jgi:hypothetical protein
MFNGIKKALQNWDAKYSDGETPSKCHWYNISDILDPIDD